MAAQDYPILEIDAEFVSQGNVTGVFEMRKATVEETTRTGYLVSSGSQIIGALSEIFADGEPTRKNFSVDFGGGQHAFEIDFVSLGADDGQWGRTNDTSVIDEPSATGGDRIQKSNILHNYIRHANSDSFTPARLKYGEWAPNGVMPADYLSVAIEDPNALSDRETSSVIDGSLTLVETVDLQQTLTGVKQTLD